MPAKRRAFWRPALDAEAWGGRKDASKGAQKAAQGGWRRDLIPRISRPNAVHGWPLGPPDVRNNLRTEAPQAAPCGFSRFEGPAPHLEQVLWQFRAVRCRP